MWKCKKETGETGRLHITITIFLLSLAYGGELLKHLAQRVTRLLECLAMLARLPHAVLAPDHCLYWAGAREEAAILGQDQRELQRTMRYYQYPASR